MCWTLREAPRSQSESGPPVLPSENRFRQKVLLCMINSSRKARKSEVQFFLSRSKIYPLALGFLWEGVGERIVTNIGMIAVKTLETFWQYIPESSPLVDLSYWTRFSTSLSILVSSAWSGNPDSSFFRRDRTNSFWIIWIRTISLLPQSFVL